MFEAHVLHLLRKYLGEYVHGLSNEALRISVWKGDVVLKDLKLKSEALNCLKLPVIVNAGFIGTITLKVPWKSLGKEPVVVLIDRVFILAHPTPDGENLREEEREKIFEAKLQHIEEVELATLEAATRGKSGSAPAGNSWLGSFIATVIGNLKITISNVHIRYEDSVSNPGHPFCSGITLAKLAAVTMDEHGNETFVTSGALDKLRKSLHLQRLALYHDSNSHPWMLQKKWEDLSPLEWTEIFADGIDMIDVDQCGAWAINRKYLVSPINGVLKYHRLGKLERHDPEIPFEKASLDISDVSLTVLEAQYYDGIRLLEALAKYKTRIEVSHLRPVTLVPENPVLWWRYVVQATLQQKKMCYKFSWERIKHLCQLRRHYVQLYASSLKQLEKADNSEIRQIERELDSKVIILWRLLAHAKIESVKTKEESQHRSATKRSWWPFGWYSSSGDALGSNDPVQSSSFAEEKLTKEEWQAINKMLSYEDDEDAPAISGKDMHTMIQFLIDVSIGQAAARVIGIDQTEILCGRFEKLNVSTKLYHKSIHCDVLLRFCGLSSPEGTLAQSVCSGEKINALAASFVYSPIGENVDWRLSAAIAPCHATVLMESYERFLGFLKRSNAISPEVALETATALQMKIEKVTRRAQEQFQIVLEEQNRFALDIDLDAPKIRIPLGERSHALSHGHFLLDFGHFTLQTREDDHDEQRKSLYSRFYISGKDIAAFFMDGRPTNGKCSTMQIIDESDALPSNLRDENSFYSLIDRCRMSVIVDQIKVLHPNYPSTRISIQVPTLGIHFSPARYCRIFDLLSVFYGSKESNDHGTNTNKQTGIIPWNSGELASDARVLVWRGIGNSMAEWHHCFLVLSGVYLYVLESETSQYYQRCCSMSGRHVFEVSPASIGGSLHSIAVSFRGIDVQKALESSSTLVIEFHDDAEKATWLKSLVHATYKASQAPPVMDILEKTSSRQPDSPAPTNNFGAADLVINGRLDETKLSIYGKFDKSLDNSGEALILNLLASGGKVNLVQSVSGLKAKMKLHSLKIRDELQGVLTTTPQYLAYSLLKSNNNASNSCASNHCEELSPKVSEEDDIFKDALPDFISFPDRNLLAQNVDMLTNAGLSSLDDNNHFSAVMSADCVEFGKCKAKGKCAIHEVFYEAEENDCSDFVDVTFVSTCPDSPLYDGTDTLMSIWMSKLDFFCYRPTLVALIELGLDLCHVDPGVQSVQETYDPLHDSSKEGGKSVESERSIIKGLLGHGKRRVVFSLHMDVDSVSVFLNKEDGSQLAMLVQERFLLGLKIHPSSITIDGTLGNMKLCDMSMGPDHYWGWLCDIRDQRVESLIKFKFQSYSAEDDDYEGHDYSLSGQLSAVRIVFLYRFVQEIMAYFMELATPHTEEVIKLVDKVGDFERLIKKYEVDGATSLKLDLALDTPVIIVPYNTMSKDFIELDLGQLQVSNSFSWHGEPKDPSSVHLDILHAEIQGINMTVGINGVLGKPMIREGQGLEFIVRRSLRDVFKKVPTVSVEIKIGLLHFVMSDKEYSIILDCAYTNVSEEPKIVPSFRMSNFASKESIRMLADRVNLNSQMLLSHTVAVVTVDIQQALLELCNGLDEESPLAQISLEGLWVSYRYSSLFEADLYVTIPKFSILDIRPNTEPEMQLMLGSSSNIPKQGSCCYHHFNETCSMTSMSHMDASNLTMLVMDCRWRTSSQSIVIRFQQPRVLVVLDFLLAVAEFFVPSLRTITGRDETLDPKNDPLARNDNIILVEPIHMQRTDVVVLSPRRQLIVDGPVFQEVIYDGCGGTIHLTECEANEYQSSGLNSLIIIIGRGKKLRFRNVKIENGSLLSKCTYLECDSSYSISEDDGVQISLKGNYIGDEHTEKFDGGHQESMKDKDNQKFNSNPAPQQIYSFSFESQVVSPEFTFYDSTKFFLDDSLCIEKLLRAKMDLSFMFATKDNDVWVRSLVKDLTVEAGSGLVVLDPVNISGAYTSVKDKTNISVISSNVCMHLSLSVASLLLRLQHQAAAALQSGNASPIAPCTNFKRLWVSQKDGIPGYNLTFWRPQAPTNYSILGDCVTTRQVPPSKAVMAVSNTYGRVRKPLGFKLIGFVSDIQGTEEEKGHDFTDGECSVWMPLAPPGYSALGYVVHLGSQPPPNHIVYCIRSDLITSTKFSDCIFSVPPNSRSLDGLSIWRVDNVAGSFCAHASLDYPSNIIPFDLHHVLLSSHGSGRSFHNKMRFSTTSDYSQNDNVAPTESSTDSSGWDVLRSLSKSSGCYMYTPHFEKIWWDRSCDLRRPISIWRPLHRPGFSSLGDCVVNGLEPPSLGVIFKCDTSGISARPVQFTKVAHITKKGLDEASIWYPIAPPGYVSLGCIVTKANDVPNKESFCCPRMDLVDEAKIFVEPVSMSSSKGSNWSIWKVDNQAGTFLARSDHRKPSCRLAFTLSDYVKPKARQNISAEMKLGSFSLTILDTAYGMMTPLFDLTITNTNLATHGRLEALNAVLICSIATSTFNRQLEAWEPLLEPFDGIFKAETYGENGDLPRKVGKRIRVTATSILNLNLSVGNLETLGESTISWKNLIDLEKKLTRKSEESGEYLDADADADSTFSALEDDDLKKVIFENRLGCDLYLRKVDESLETIELLHHENCMTLSIPAPRFSDRLNIVTESKENHKYIAIQLFQAKGLPIVDDGNDNNFFCALRLVIDSSTSDRHNLFPQSARSKCTKPFILKVEGIDKGIATWNEIFLFEAPKKGSAFLELEVTNLSSKAGKGEIVGALSIPIKGDANTLKRASSISMLQELGDNQEILSYPLKRRAQSGAVKKDYGSLSLSTSIFVQRSINPQREKDNTVGTDGDTGFWVGLGPLGPWESFGSLLALSVIPKSLDGRYFAFEVYMKNGRKHAVFRPLVTIVNDADVKLEVLVCPESTLGGSLGEIKNSVAVVTEEFFENQCSQSSPVHGNRWSSVRDSDPGPWSTRDLSNSWMDISEVLPPSGWKWTCPWTIDKTGFVDSEGWAYGSDFHSIKWPPSPLNQKPGSSSNVRRRRWIRTRKAQKNVDLTNMLSVINPGSSALLPLSIIASDLDLCLQVRPCGKSPEVQCTWGQAFSLASTSNIANDEIIFNPGLFSRQNTMNHGKISMVPSSLMLNQLEKKDVILRCNSISDSKQHFWLSAGIDASVLHTDINIPVYDWKITVSSPLRLENKLPYEAEYFVWEKLSDDNFVERQHGVMLPERSAFIYLADLCKPIYLTLFVQGGWVLEKDPILIMDLFGLELASSFWMTHKQISRRLRVSIERDIGGNSAAPKTIRFFVPYWINNDSGVDLSYRIMEIEPFCSGEADSPSLTKGVKSARLSLKHTSSFIDKRKSSFKRNIQLLEEIEDLSPSPIMLSPLDYINRSGILQFSTCSESNISARVGIAVSACHSKHYSPGISLYELENKGRIDFKVFSASGSYYKLSAVLKMASDRTKVIDFQPQTIFINRVGCSICLNQFNLEHLEWLHPTDSLKFFEWKSNTRDELLKLRMEGYKWSAPFSIQTEGVMNISLRDKISNKRKFLRVEVRSGAKNSHYEVVFSLATYTSPYRIENRSQFLPMLFRQIDGFDDSWQHLLPNTSASFCWEDLGRQQQLEIIVDGSDPLKSETYNIDDVMDHQPRKTASGPMKTIRVTVSKEENINICRISDWMPEMGTLPTMQKGSQLPSSELSDSCSSPLDNEFHLIVEVADLGLSIIDHMPEEVLYFSIQGLLLSYSTGLGSGISRFKLRMLGLQVDNQLPFTPMPVLFRPQRIGVHDDPPDYIIKLSLTMQKSSSLDLHIYPYLSIQGPENSAFLVNIHEPVIWRLHEMIQQAKLSRIYGSENSAISVDPKIQIGLFNISEIRFKVSMAMSPSQRPGGVLGFWSSLMTALGNMENMPVKINQRFHEDVCMRQSALISTAVTNIQKDLLSQPLRLLSGVDILGNASSALGHMSKGLAALSMDKKFIQNRQKQESKSIEDISDVIREGGGALAKGFFRGVTGILTKPLEGAKSSGVEGFVQGVGKGIIGAAAQPVSGVLDLLSKTTEGANAVRMKIASAITSEEQLLRKRFPRAIGGDNLLRPFDEYRATGQAILQLAECGTFFGQVDLFKVRGKFALSDAYEDHFLLPEGKILLVTHRRVLLLQQPANVAGQKKFNPARDPCSVLWDVLWEDLATMELTHEKKDNQGSLPSHLVLYLGRMTEVKEFSRVIKCIKESQQAIDIYSSIERAMNTYGPNHSKEIEKRVTKPYSPICSGDCSQLLPKDVYSITAIQQVPPSVSTSSTFGVVLPQDKLGTSN